MKSASPVKNMESSVVAVEHQASSKVDGEIVVLSLKNGVYYGLNAVGARIWELIQEPITVENIVDIITEYDVKRDRCKQDVLQLLDRLEEYGLIRVDKAHLW